MPITSSNAYIVGYDPSTTITTNCNPSIVYWPDTQLYAQNQQGAWNNIGQITNVIYTAGVTASDSQYYSIQWPYVTGGTYTPTQVVYYGDYVVHETEEQRIARVAAFEAGDRKRKAAEEKAEELLLMCLSDEQKEMYLKYGYLEINTDKAKYRIKKGWAKNVEKIGHDGKTELKYCIHPSDCTVPIPDSMLAQKLMLEYNEQEFLRLANKWSV